MLSKNLILALGVATLTQAIDVVSLAETELETELETEACPRRSGGCSKNWSIVIPSTPSTPSNNQNN